MKSVYDELPILENERLMLRAISEDDLGDLLKVYSDERAVPFFNSDNCDGDDFHYTTPERMKAAFDFWMNAYKEHYFVRMSIIDKNKKVCCGTIELFHRDADDFFNDAGLLRIDLSGDYEKSGYISDILELLIPVSYYLFNCTMIATKAVPSAKERISALVSNGFSASDEELKGNDGRKYGDYYVRHAGFMDEAVREAYIGIHSGHGGPFGAVIVKNGKIIGRGHNVVVSSKDPTAHGEISAIRDACRREGSYHLKGCEIYTTAQPCPMCLGAILWANIDKVWYGCTCNDTSGMLHFEDNEFYDVIKGERDYFMKSVDRDSCLKLFDDYKRIRNKKSY